MKRNRKMWRKRKIYDVEGYDAVYLPDSPVSHHGLALIHRAKMAEKLGRPLGRNEYVHHKDGNRRNNRITNLQLVSPREHAQLHAARRRMAS